MRNTLCPYYNECLDKRALKNLPPWSCESCRHKTTTTQIPDIEIEASYLLLWAIFKPERYSKYLELKVKSMGAI
jgi:hypothetical protein